MIGYIFRNSLTEAQVIPQTVAKSREVDGYEKVVVMYANDDALAKSGYDAFIGALKNAGVEILEGVDSDRLIRRFGILTGTNPCAWVVDQRIRQAHRILEEDPEALVGDI